MWIQTVKISSLVIYIYKAMYITVLLKCPAAETCIRFEPSIL